MFIGLINRVVGVVFYCSYFMFEFIFGLCDKFLVLWFWFFCVIFIINVGE